jgi:hypothetical protein
MFLNNFKIFNRFKGRKPDLKKKVIQLVTEYSKHPNDEIYNKIISITDLILRGGHPDKPNFRLLVETYREIVKLLPEEPKFYYNLGIGLINLSQQIMIELDKLEVKANLEEYPKDKESNYKPEEIEQLNEEAQSSFRKFLGYSNDLPKDVIESVEDIIYNLRRKTSE